MDTEAKEGVTAGDATNGEPVSSAHETSADGRPRRRRDRTGLILVDRYVLTRKIGEGGMGEVFEAKHIGLGQPVAIKLLHEGFLQRECYRERFWREAKTLASLRSEHIVAVTDYGETAAGLPFMVMEYLEGEDLRKLLKRHAILPVARAVKLVADACKGVGVAHAKGLVHRDIKPENLFVSTNPSGSESCKVLDFGVAKQSDASTLTRDGALIGTARYMAPEQALGQKDIDGRVDVFALGSILHECLSGEPAFDGDRPEAILFAIIHRAPAALSNLNPDVPKSLAQIVRRALSRNPADRYQSIDEFAAALEAFQARTRNLTAKPTRTSDASHSLGPGDATLAETSDGATIDHSTSILTASPSPRRLRSRFMFAGGVLAGALLGAGATVSAISPKAKDPLMPSTQAASRALESPLPAALGAEPAVPSDRTPHPATLEPPNKSPPPASNVSQPPDLPRRIVQVPVSEGAPGPQPVARPAPPATPARSAQTDSTRDAAEQASTEASLDLVPNPYRR